MNARKFIKWALCIIASLVIFYIFNRLTDSISVAYSAALANNSAYNMMNVLSNFPSSLISEIYISTNQTALLVGISASLAVIGFGYCASSLGSGFYAEGEEHGTGKISPPSSLALYADKNSVLKKDGVTYDTNMIISANIRKRLDYHVPVKIREYGKVSNVMVFAESGGGKTWEYVLPNCLQLFGSMVIVDTKGDIYKNTALFYKQANYNVRILNVTDGLLHTQGFNFMRYCRAEEDIPEFIDTLIAVTTGENEKLDWFAKAEGSILKALASYAWEVIGEPSGKEVSLTDIMQLLNLVEIDPTTGTRPFEDMLDSLARNKPDCMAKEHYRGFKAFADSPKTTASILGSVHVRLQNAKTKGAQAALSKDEMYLEDLTKTRTVIYVIIDDEEPRPYQFVSALFFSTLTKVISRQAKASETGRIDVPVHMMIDETRNVGKIATLTGAISQIRSKGGSISTIWQNYGQAVEVYGKEGAQTLWQNSPTKIFLGGDDLETNDMLSKTFGETTAKKQSKSKTRGKNDSTSQSSQTLNRRVVMTDELGRMRPPWSYIKVSGFDVVRDTRYDVTKHPNYSFTGYKTRQIAALDDIITRDNSNQQKVQISPMGINPQKAYCIEISPWMGKLN